MPFSISQMIVDGAENVVALDWTYSNSDGSLGNQHKLLEPYGAIPLSNVTKDVATGWLTEQLGNSTEDFDAALAKRKAEAEYAESLVPYTVHLKSAPTKIEQSEPEPTPEASTMPASRREKSE